MDSEVTFEDDPDEEMDATTIEEEEWIDYIKRSTVDALEKMELTSRLHVVAALCGWRPEVWAGRAAARPPSASRRTSRRVVSQQFST